MAEAVTGTIGVELHRDGEIRNRPRYRCHRVVSWRQRPHGGEEIARSFGAGPQVGGWRITFQRSQQHRSKYRVHDRVQVSSRRMLDG